MKESSLVILLNASFFTDASHIGLDQEEVAYDGLNFWVELSL